MEVTDLLNNVFQKARLKLAFYFFLFAVLVIVILSFTLYFQTRESYREAYKKINLTEAQETIWTQSNEERTRDLILLTDIALIIISGFFAYIFAKKTLKPVEDINKTQMRFIADASHELRTPLTIMKTHLELARGEKVNSKVIESNLEEVDRMTKIVEDMLLLSRMDSNQEKLLLKSINLTDVISKCITLLRPYAQKKYIQIEYKPKGDILIFGDSDKLKQATLNIVKNAIDYSYKNSKIDIKLSKSSQYAILEVADKGIGIPEEDLSNIYERFYKASNAKSGNGLGLAIVKWIIDKHKGKIEIESKINIGTNVKLSIPLAS